MSFAPVALVLVAAVVYARGIRYRGWPAWRTLLFLLGLAATVGALSTPLDGLAHELFSAHMAQHMLLTVVAAPLLLLGQPVRPLLRGLPPGVRRHIVRPLALFVPMRALLHAVRLPLVAAPIYILGLYVWHVPRIYDAAVAIQPLHDLEHTYFLVSGLLFWSAVIDPEPFRSPLPYPLRIVFLLLTGAAQNTILGGLLAFSSRPLYPHYVGRPEVLGIEGLTDQRFGGALMWVVGDLIFLAAASLCFFLFLAKEERDQVAREAADGG